MAQVVAFYARPRLLCSRRWESGETREMMSIIAGLGPCQGYRTAQENALAKSIADSFTLHESNLLKTFVAAIQDIWNEPVFQRFVKTYPIVTALAAQDSEETNPEFGFDLVSQVWPLLEGSTPTEKFSILWFECLSICRTPIVDVNALLIAYAPIYFELSNIIIAEVVERQCFLSVQQKLLRGLDSWQPDEAVFWKSIDNDSLRTIRDNVRLSDYKTSRLVHPPFAARRLNPLTYKAPRGSNKTTPQSRSRRNLAPPMTRSSHGRPPAFPLAAQGSSLDPTLESPAPTDNPFHS